MNKVCGFWVQPPFVCPVAGDSGRRCCEYLPLELFGSVVRRTSESLEPSAIEVPALLVPAVPTNRIARSDLPSGGALATERATTAAAATTPTRCPVCPDGSRSTSSWQPHNPSSDLAAGLCSDCGVRTCVTCGGMAHDMLRGARSCADATAAVQRARQVAEECNRSTSLPATLMRSQSHGAYGGSSASATSTAAVPLAVGVERGGRYDCVWIV